MADVRLVKPAAGSSRTIACEGQERLVFDFPADAVMLSRDGDDMLMTFEDGSSLRLESFYAVYSKESLPSFEVDGAEISGQDFFMAMNEPDLMPAAGRGSSFGRGNGN